VAQINSIAGSDEDDEVYGAPIDEADVTKIFEYLAQTY
jgi:hypothetical protein